MTALVQPSTPSLIRTHLTGATPAERLLLRALRAIERATLLRVEKRGDARGAATAPSHDDRRTALALGGLGILPR